MFLACDFSTHSTQSIDKLNTLFLSFIKFMCLWFVTTKSLESSRIFPCLVLIRAHLTWLQIHFCDNNIPIRTITRWKGHAHQLVLMKYKKALRVASTCLSWSVSSTEHRLKSTEMIVLKVREDLGWIQLFGYTYMSCTYYCMIENY